MINMIMKTKISTITAAIATIAAMATMGSLGGAGQQLALASIAETDLPIDIELPDVRLGSPFSGIICPEGTTLVYNPITGFSCVIAPLTPP